MKNDMSGAAAILAAMAELADLGCPAQVTGYLMCTDNMPSGTATGARRRDHDARRHDGRGDQHRRRGSAGDGRRPRAGDRGTHRRDRRHRHAHRRVHAGARHPGRRRDRQRPGPRRPGPRRGRGHRRAGVAAAPRPALPQGARLDGRRPQEPRRRQRRGDHRGACSSPSSSATCRGPTSTSPAPRKSSADAGWQTAGCTGFGARLLAELAVHFTAP